MDKFFQLLQLALDERHTFTEEPEHSDWLYMMDMAKRQALIGICMAGIEKLPETLRPPKELMRHWILETGKIEQRNRWMNQKCGELTDLLLARGFYSCILKGQGIASLYPEPLRRQSGDIDILLLPEDGTAREVTSSFFQRVIGLARSVYKEAEVVYHHADIEIATERTVGGTVTEQPVNDHNRIEVELHCRISWFYSPLRNHHLQNWFVRQEHFTRKSPDGTFNMPATSFNVIFILVHIYRHLFDEGIGLRQCLDYYYVLKECARDNILWKDIHPVLADLGLTRFCAALMYVLHTVFGLEERMMVMPMDSRNGRFLLEEIMQSGNFGQYNTVCKRHESLLSRFVRRQRRNLRFLSRYPEEVICAPFWILWHRGWRMYHGYI
ncbi:MAG: nucleotidyltransferase family protein [Bacteroides sp.]|nr:nucleotidyltransferase family protein [Roseburia sp.]MCM1345990.1 nucleotidyltransferase family protein [Bacteroides sp.]MCM1420851.1 nucleotidyltransferase family protein [Bacteroides sp.]